MAEIIVNKDAPFELVQLIQQACDETPQIHKVIIDAFIKELKVEGKPPALGAFDPDQGIIILDLGNCLTDRRWMDKGIRYAANVWLNMMFAFYHEVAHALQLVDEPELAKLDELPAEYEAEAYEMAEEVLLNWAENNKVPKIEHMAWAGEQILEMFNAIYSAAPDLIMEELRLNGTEAVAEAIAAAKGSGSYGTPEGAYDSPEDTTKLVLDIQNGQIGTVIDGKAYLTIYEAINMNHYIKGGSSNDELTEDAAIAAGI